MTTSHKITTVYFEDVQVGMAAPQIEKHPNEVALFMFSAITWDTHRTHWDSPYAVQEEKLPGMLVHGHLQGAWLAELMTDWIGPMGKLKKIEYRNRAMSIQGDHLTVKGKVTEIRDGAPGRGLVTCEVWIEKHTGEVTTSGTTTVELPKRGH